VSFEEYEMNIDLSQFNNVDLEEEKITTSYRMQKIDQLLVSIDTLQTNFSEELEVFNRNFSKKSVVSSLVRDEKKLIESSALPNHLLDFIITDKDWKKSRVYDESMSKIQNALRDLSIKRGPFFAYQKLINVHKITFQEKYTLLFASLGAIIRKGGLGLPLVLSVIIFLTYHYIGLFGKNAAEDNSISPIIASWLSTLILAPFSYILTKRASADKGFISLYDVYAPILNLIKKIPFPKKS
jgi:lipopolysaccharide export system permease protein